MGLPSRLATFRALPLPRLSAGGGKGSSGRAAAAGGGASGGTSSGGTSGGSRGGASSRPEEGSLLDRTLAKFQREGFTWWDDHPYADHHHPALPQLFGKRQPGSITSITSSSSGGSSSGGGSGTPANSSRAGRRGGGEGPPPLPLLGTWAVELCNEEPARQQGRGLLAFIGGKGRGGGGGGARGLPGGRVCRIELPPQPQGMGPRISMCLPSFRWEETFLGPRCCAATLLVVCCARRRAARKAACTGAAALRSSRQALPRLSSGCARTSIVSGERL